MSYSVAILGASGYTGAELVRIIANHPKLKIQALSADRKAGMEYASVFPHLRNLSLPKLVTINEINFTNIDICFCALPHKTSQSVIKNLPRDLKVIDLSADFRISDPLVYEKWYGTRHTAPELQKEAVYGLTEFYRDEIKAGRLVAGTGCNSAAGQYALRPLISSKIIDLDNIIIDVKAGVSGAGRSLKENLLHAELSEGVHPYSVGGTHRHLAEFDQEFSKITSRKVEIQFSPHLLPMNRGILASIYVRGNSNEVYKTLVERYKFEYFIEVLPYGENPSTHHVRGSNYVHIGVIGDRIQGRVLITVAIDNLTKGSSGQAIQNANLMLGIDEKLGLELISIFP
ncbi:MAG: N-acetyl-gamma-glutamyl-phosphate reductase [Proteobacteria bacterium]|jgi:N-acetyl-gamma-glutamyl-phosphate reductase|nr:N-acetyl-gamma-glutamyl-phosphate reductase [Pseudomonadota bacterium]MDA1239139.1 N-acetyl-gamma-glutamyl-phosphate reductase [Pseudomonadota bacterium]